LTPQDLKLGVAEALNTLLEPIRQEFASSPEFQRSFELAYPKPGKKAKKAKDKGSKYPGGAKNPEQAADVVASEGVAQDVIANSAQGELKASVGADAADALAKLNVSETRQ
jgi:tyrosyl-tRNA synthetase